MSISYSELETWIIPSLPPKEDGFTMTEDLNTLMGKIADYSGTKDQALKFVKEHIVPRYYENNDGGKILTIMAPHRANWAGLK